MTKNFVEIIGFAGHDPKRSGNSNTARVRISVATNERWRDNDSREMRERTEWHSVIFWDHLADIAADFVRKGSHILVSGSIKSRQYEDKGVTRTVWEIHAREFLLLDSRISTLDESDVSRASTVDESDESAPAPQTTSA
jgi:single-strand DNA-binding protein